jgi:hypothetical protein
MSREEQHAAGPAGCSRPRADTRAYLGNRSRGGGAVASDAESCGLFCGSFLRKEKTGMKTHLFEKSFARIRKKDRSFLTNFGPTRQ